VVLLDSWGKHSGSATPTASRSGSRATWPASEAKQRLSRRRHRGAFAAPQEPSPQVLLRRAGSRLFERICRLREYYLTRAELSLTRAHIAAIARFAARGGTLIEYGSGESLKSRLLIGALRPATYIPVDISHDALQAAARRLAREFPRSISCRWWAIFRGR